jgi:hypothetical protein
MSHVCIGNGLKPNPMAGDPVHLGFSSTAGATTPQQFVVTDANGAVRTLKTTERLVITDMVGDISAGHAEVCNSSTLASSTLIASFGPNNGQWFTDGEGYPMPVGLLPWIIPNSTSSTAIINVSGTGRIMEGTTQGVRPSWREATARGD